MSQPAAVPVPGSSEEDNVRATDPSAEPQGTEDFFSPPGRRGGRSEEQQFRLFQQFMRQQELQGARRDRRRDDSDDEGASGGRGASAGPPPECMAWSFFRDHFRRLVDQSTTLAGNYKDKTTSSWTHDFEGTSWTSLRALQVSGQRRATG